MDIVIRIYKETNGFLNTEMYVLTRQLRRRADRDIKNANSLN